MHQPFIGFKKAYGSVRREVLHITLIAFGIPMKLVRLIKMCLTETYSRVGAGKNLSDMFPIRNKEMFYCHCFSNFALRYAIRRVQLIQEGLQLNGTHQLLVYADKVDVLGGSVYTIKENGEALLVSSKDFGPEVNAVRTKYMVMSRDASHESKPSSVTQGYLDSYSTLPGITWEAVTVLEGYPDEGYYDMCLLTGLWSTQAKVKVSC